MTTTYAEAKTPRTQAELRALLLSRLADTPLAGMSESAPQRKIVDDIAARGAEESEIRADMARMVDLRDLAALDRSWCRAWMSFFDEDFIPALPAFWDVPFKVEPALAPVTLGGAVVVQLQDNAGRVYESTADVSVTLSASSSPTAYEGTLRMRARVAGTAGNGLVASGGAKIITGPAGISGANPGPVLYTAGRDEETIAAAIARCLGKWARLGAGWTLDAFDYLIPTLAPTVTRWKVRDDNPLGEGTVKVVIANPAGAATGPEVAAVQAGLAARGVRPLGSGPVTVVAATEQPVALSAALDDDGSNATITDDAEAAAQAFFKAFPIGPATVDDGIVRAVLLGASFASIAIEVDGGTQTITPDLPGFKGALGLTSLSYGAPLSVSDDSVLVVTPTVT